MLKRKNRAFKPQAAATSSGSSNGSTIAGDVSSKPSGAIRSLLAKFGGGSNSSSISHHNRSISTQNLSTTSLENLPGRGATTSTLPSSLGVSHRPYPRGRDDLDDTTGAMGGGAGLLERRREKASSLQHLALETGSDATIHRASVPHPTPPYSPPTPDTKSLMSVASTSVSRAVSSREVLVECLVGAKRIHASSDLFLLSGDRIHTPSLNHLNSDRHLERFDDCLDELLSRLRVFPILVGSVQATLQADAGMEPIRLSDPRECVQRFVSAIDVLCELTSACVFAMSSRCAGWVAPRPGLIERQAVLIAADEVDLCCHRLRLSERTSADSAGPEEESDMLATACSRLSRCLSFFAATSRMAASAASEEAAMFVLAVRSLTANATCLLESVRHYCSSPGDERRARMAAFANALGATVQALVTMVTDERFAGQPALAPPQTKGARTKLFGACLNLSSASIQFLNSLADLCCNRTASLQRRSVMCSDAISEAVNHFLSIIAAIQATPPSRR